MPEYAERAVLEALVNHFIISNANVGDHDGDMSETKLTERQRKILNLF